MLDCALIVISYRSARDVAGLIATVPAAVSGLSWRLLVVNNDPAEDLGMVVAPHAEVEVVEADGNLGYAGGINLALASAPKSRWIIFLNPDVRLTPGSIAAMTACAGNEHAVVPKIVDDDGTVQRSLRREPTVLGSLGDALFGDHWDNRPSWFSEMVREPLVYQRRHEVDWATGAALVVPAAAVRVVGAWDAKRFFLYSEETDYCRRLRCSGTGVYYSPAAVVSHRGGGSGTSDALHALLEVNRVRYFRKWHQPLAAGVFAAVVVLNNLLRIRRSRSRAALRALLFSSTRSALPGRGDRARP